jgi:hypothetical protein
MLSQVVACGAAEVLVDTFNSVRHRLPNSSSNRSLQLYTRPTRLRSLASAPFAHQLLAPYTSVVLYYLQRDKLNVDSHISNECSDGASTTSQAQKAVNL